MPNWTEYSIDPRATVDPEELSRAEARSLFEAVMESRAERVSMLAALLRSDGVALGGTDAEVQRLNDWFVEHVEADAHDPAELSLRWRSVCLDVGLYLGETLIARYPHLEWRLFTWGKSSISFQRHVVMGLRAENPKMHTNFDPESLVQGYAYEILEHRGGVPRYGVVDIKGVQLDLDSVLAGSPRKDPSATRFVDYLATAEWRA